MARSAGSKEVLLRIFRININNPRVTTALTGTAIAMINVVLESALLEAVDVGEVVCVLKLCAVDPAVDFNDVDAFVVVIDVVVDAVVDVVAMLLIVVVVAGSEIEHQHQLSLRNFHVNVTYSKCEPTHLQDTRNWAPLQD